jgi:PPOX class probable F420-dependent enzyme
MISDPSRRLQLAQSLGRAPYVALTTYRKDGTPVSTPMQVVPRGEFLFFWTRADSGKVKRLNRDQVVRVAACTVRGKITGPSFVGIGRVLTGGAEEMARELMLYKYGAKMKWSLRVQRLFGKNDERVAIQVTLEPELDDHDDSPALRD